MSGAILDAAVVRGSQPVSLTAIRHRDAALAIWDRPVPPVLARLLAAVDWEEVDDVHCVIAAGEPLDGPLRDAGYPDAVAEALAADIGDLARHQAALTGGPHLALRLEVVETDACRRFHADYVTLRLLCTYRGPGTQWCAADRPDAVEAMATGAVGVFKGRLLIDPPAVLHRSPPIVATGDRRLVLAIDPADPDERPAIAG